MPGRLEGKSAIITGAARGIGLGIAKSLADHGARVLLVDQDGDLVADAARQLRDNGHDAHALRADVSKALDMQKAAQFAIANFGGIDILCPNAAVFDSSPLVTMPEALWDRLLTINLKGVFLSVQACLPHMIARNYGRIVVTSSITGNRTAIANMAHYAASKGGIAGFVKAAAIELAKHGITVNS